MMSCLGKISTISSLDVIYIKKMLWSTTSIFTINRFTCRGYRDHKITTPTWLTVSQTLLLWTVFFFKSSTSTSPIQTVPTPIPLVTESVVSKVSTHYPYRCSNIQQLLLLPAISNALDGGKSTTYKERERASLIQFKSSQCRTHPNPFFCETNAYPTIGMWYVCVCACV